MYVFEKLYGSHAMIRRYLWLNLCVLSRAASTIRAMLAWFPLEYICIRPNINISGYIHVDNVTIPYWLYYMIKRTTSTGRTENAVTLFLYSVIDVTLYCHKLFHTIGKSMAAWLINYKWLVSKTFLLRSAFNYIAYNPGQTPLVIPASYGNFLMSAYSANTGRIFC